MENGIYPEDALKFKEIAMRGKRYIEVRTGAPVPAKKGDDRFAPKPIDTHVKTKKTSGFTMQLLSVREAGTLEGDAKFNTNTYHIPLGKVLAKDHEGHSRYQLMKEQSDFKTGRLVFKSRDPEADPNVLYSINLGDSRKLQKPSVWAEDIDRPDWWDESLSKNFDFNQAINERFPAQYRTVNDNRFRDDLVYAVRDKKGRLVNIAGDNDLYAISVPMRELEKLDPSLVLERINTFEKEGTRKMLRKRVELEGALRGTPLSTEETQVFAAALVSAEKISKVGNLTAYESKVISELNEDIPDFKHKPVQHAPETGNKFYPQPVTKTLIFTPEGEVLVLKNEQDLVNWRRTPEVIKNHFYQVSEKANMNLWSAYVADQLLLKQPVSADVIKRFVENVEKRFRQKDYFLGTNIMEAYKGLSEQEKLSIPLEKRSSIERSPLDRQESSEATLLVKKASIQNNSSEEKTTVLPVMKSGRSPF